MSQSIGWYICIVTLYILLCSPDRMCLAFRKVEKRAAVAVYVTSPLTAGDEDKRKTTTDSDRWKDSTGLYDQAAHTSQSGYVYGAASQPPGTSANGIFSVKVEGKQTPESTSESLKTGKDLDILFPTISVLADSQNTATTGKMKDVNGDGPTKVMLATAVTVTPSLESITESDILSKTVSRDISDVVTQANSATSYFDGLINSSEHLFVTTDLKHLNVTKGNIRTESESTSLPTNPTLTRDEEMLTTDQRTENVDAENYTFTKPVSVATQTHGSVSGTSPPSTLNDSPLATVRFPDTIPAQETIRQSANTHQIIEPNNASAEVNVAEVTTLSVPFVSILKDEWQNTRLGTDSKAQTISHDIVIQTQVLKQSPWYLDINGNNIHETGKSTVTAVTGSRSAQAADATEISKPTVGAEQESFLTTFTGPVSANAATNVMEGDTITPVITAETTNATAEGKINTTMSPLWTMGVPNDAQISSSVPERTDSEGLSNVETTETVGRTEVLDATVPTMKPTQFTTQEIMTTGGLSVSRNMRKTTAMPPTIQSTTRRNSVAPAITPTGSSLSVSNRQDSEVFSGFTMAMTEQASMSESSILRAKLSTIAQATMTTKKESEAMMITAAPVVSSVEATAAPSVRHTIATATDGLDRLDSEEDEEEDEDEDTDSEDESTEDDTELPTFTPPSPTPQEFLSDGRNLTHLGEMSYRVPDALEWEKQNQGLVRSWMEKLKDKAGYMSGMLLPVGVGIAGALFILGALYSIKVMNRKRRNGFKRNKRKRECNSMQDRVMLLADSSEDEF